MTTTTQTKLRSIVRVAALLAGESEEYVKAFADACAKRLRPKPGPKPKRKAAKRRK